MANISKDNALMEFPLQIKRQFAAPLDTTELFYSLEEAKEYAKNGATSYAGQTIKVVDETAGTVSTYTIQVNGELLQSGSAEHTHSPNEIIETDEKQFVSKAEKTSFADKYTKAETDEKFKAAISGLAFKGTFNTLADLPSADEAKDGWFAIVINEPTANGKNVMVIFESADSEWKQLGDLLVPGIVTDLIAGLMSPEMFIKLQGIEEGANKYIHPDTHPAAMIVEDETHRFVTDTEKASWADKYTKAEIETKLADVNSKIETAKEELSNSITTLDTKTAADKVELTEKITAAETTLTTKIDTAKTELEAKITEVADSLVAATEEQIDALFA